MAAMGGNVDSSAVPKSASVETAHELVQAGHQYLDVRTPQEFTAGHAVGAINIPYLLYVGSGMSKNPKFLEEVSSHFKTDDKIVVACQAGKRSLMAAKDLVSAGFTEVTDVVGGYAAWTEKGLPTES
jgi:rhodanese-related sulfurtransferase